MNLKVALKSGLNDCSIELIQHIEKSVDAVMSKNGFTRTTTSKSGDCVEFNYRQFGKAL